MQLTITTTPDGSFEVSTEAGQTVQAGSVEEVCGIVSELLEAGSMTDGGDELSEEPAEMDEEGSAMTEAYRPMGPRI